MSEVVEQETVDSALRLLDQGWDAQTEPMGEADREARELLEAMALLAITLPEIEPSAEVKEQLMAQLGDRQQGSRDQAVDAPVIAIAQPDRPPQAPHSANDLLMATGDDAADLTLHQPSPYAIGGTDAGDLTLVGVGTEADPIYSGAERRGYGGMLALAAALALCLIGLGYLYGQVEAKDALLTLQQARLQELPRIEGQLRNNQQQQSILKQRLDMVTTVARQAYPMRTAEVADQGLQPAPEGIVYVCGNHQQWLLALHGLEPAPNGSEYHLWFVTEDGKQHGGLLEVVDGEADMEQPSMPDGTHGFVVTLEPAGEIREEPLGEMILLGEDAVNL